MLVRVTNLEATRRLVRFFRSRGYLAVQREPRLVEAVPIAAASEEADRRRLLADLDDWHAENPDAEASVVPDDPS